MAIISSCGATLRAVEPDFPELKRSNNQLTPHHLIGSFRAFSRSDEDVFR
jgi:hypothetical protein